MAFWGHHLIMLGVWLILVLSLNLINGSCGLFSLGHQGFWMAGAYAAGAVMKYFPHCADCPNWIGFFLSFPVAILVAAFFGLLVGIPCLRLKGDYLAIATLGFGEILRNLIQNSELLGGSYALQFRDDTIGGNLPGDGRHILFLLLAWGGVAVVAAILYNLARSSHGRAINAIRDDERAAELLGVNLTKYKVFVFVTGAGMAGLAGAIFANYTVFLTYVDFDFNQGVLMVVMVVLGGMGSMRGAFIATAILHFIPILLNLWLPDDTRFPIFYDPTWRRGDPNASHWAMSDFKGLWQVLYSALLIFVVLALPNGIMSKKDWFLRQVAWVKAKALGLAGKKHA